MLTHRRTELSLLLPARSWRPCTRLHLRVVLPQCERKVSCLFSCFAPRDSPELPAVLSNSSVQLGCYRAEMGQEIPNVREDLEQARLTSVQCSPSYPNSLPRS